MQTLTSIDQHIVIHQLIAMRTSTLCVPGGADVRLQRSRVILSSSGIHSWRESFTAQMAVCIGVDGGGTKTAAVICRVNDEVGATGTFVGRGFAGPSNKNSVGAEPAVAALWQAVADALEEAQLGAIGDAAVACIVLSMAGCDTEEDGAFWRQACAAVYPSARVVVENDSVAALCSGTDGILCGIVVISGTGSIGLGIASPQAQRHRVGGMGPMLGDGGNGYSIGLAALGAAVRSADGRGAATPLRQMILDKYSLRDVDGLLGLAYGASARFNNWDEVASLAPLVFRAHEERSCPVASAILQQAAAEICVIVETVAARLQMGRNDEVQVPVVLAGRCAFWRPPHHTFVCLENSAGIRPCVLTQTWLCGQGVSSVRQTHTCPRW